jgi:hypothetical protein
MSFALNITSRLADCQAQEAMSKTARIEVYGMDDYSASEIADCSSVHYSTLNRALRSTWLNNLVFLAPASTGRVIP